MKHLFQLVFGKMIARYVAYRDMGLGFLDAILSLDSDPTLIRWQYVRNAWTQANDPLYAASFWHRGWKLDAVITVNPQPDFGSFSNVPGTNAVAIKDGNGFRWFIPNTKARNKVLEMVEHGVDPDKAEALVESWVVEEARSALSYGKEWVLYGVRVYATRAGRRIGVAEINGLSGDMVPSPDPQFEEMARRLAPDAIADAMAHINRQLRSVATVSAIA